MKRPCDVSWLLLFFLAGCATTPQVPQYEFREYVKPVPNYPLKCEVYYQPNVKDSQFLENEYNQYGKEETGYYRVAYGMIIVKKFDSALMKLFTEVQRSHVTDLPTRFLEAKSKNLDLLCDIQLVKNSFKNESQQSVAKSTAKAMLGLKAPYSSTTDLEMRIAFYKPDGSVLLEKAYPYTKIESISLPMNTTIMTVLRDYSNDQFSQGVDEVISQMIDELAGSEKFKELADSKR